MSLGPQCLGPQCLLKGLGPQCPDLNVWDLNVRDLIVIAPSENCIFVQFLEWDHLKSGHQSSVFRSCCDPLKYIHANPVILGVLFTNGKDMGRCLPMLNR